MVISIYVSMATLSNLIHGALLDLNCERDTTELLHQPQRLSFIRQL